MSLMDKEQAEAAVRALGKATVGAVRAANELPGGRDYVLHKSSYKDFQARVAGPKGSGTVEKRVLSLLDRIFSHVQGEPSSFARTKGVEPDDVFETVVDFADARLEAVDFLLDEMAGRAPKVKAGVVGAAAYGGGSGKGGKFSALIRGKPEDLGLAKPQLCFKDPVNNANDTPFVAKAWPKAHAASDSKASAASGRHPYAAEMDAITYTPQQLAPPAEAEEPRPMDETPCTYVDTPEGLQSMHSVLLGCPEIAVDLEHHSVRSFQGFTCLMQVSTREQDFVVDTIALREHMQTLLPAFTDPSITKVFHGSDSDMRWLQCDFGLYIVNLFDTGQAARLLELPSFALAYLLDRFCGQTPDKKYQLADWRSRPLSDDMLKYARMDTHFLLFIYDKIRGLLLERDSGGERLLRSALSMSRQVAQLQYEKQVFSADSHLSVLNRSGRVMSVHQTAVFAAVFAWRDELARVRDESCDFVLPTSMLFKLATGMPKSRGEVLDVCKPNVPPLVREQVEIVAKLCSMLAHPAHASSASVARGPSEQKDRWQGVADTRYSLAGWVAEENEELTSATTKKRRAVAAVHVDASNCHASSRQPCTHVRSQSLFLGRKKVAVLEGGDVHVIGAEVANQVQEVASESKRDATAKVLQIRAAFTMEFPEALFVAAEDVAMACDAALSSPRQSAGDAMHEDEEEEVAPMKGAGLDHDGMPRAVKQVFKGPASITLNEAGEQVGGKKKKKTVEQGPGSLVEKQVEGSQGVDWVKSLGWKDHLRAKIAGTGGGEADVTGTDLPGEVDTFKPFDYSTTETAAEPKSKKQKQMDAKALLEGHFNPHEGLDGKDKQVKHATDSTASPQTCNSFHCLPSSTRLLPLLPLNHATASLASPHACGDLSCLLCLPCLPAFSSFPASFLCFLPWTTAPSFAYQSAFCVQFFPSCGPCWVLVYPFRWAWTLLRCNSTKNDTIELS